MNTVPPDTNSSEINTDSLIINTDTARENKELEMAVIKKSLNSTHGNVSYQSELEEAKNFWLSLLPVIENCDSVKQLQAVKKKMGEIPRLVDAMKKTTTPSLPNVTSTPRCNQNIVPQKRLFSVKKVSKKPGIERSAQMITDSNITAVSTILQSII